MKKVQESNYRKVCCFIFRAVENVCEIPAKSPELKLLEKVQKHEWLSKVPCIFNLLIQNETPKSLLVSDLGLLCVMTNSKRVSDLKVM